MNSVGNKERQTIDQQSSKISDQKNKENDSKQHVLYPQSFSTINQYQRPSYSTTPSPNEPQIYVLPYPPPPYMYSELPAQAGYIQHGQQASQQQPTSVERQQQNGREPIQQSMQPGNQQYSRQPPPNVHVVTADPYQQPPSVQGTPMFRPGPWRGQNEEEAELEGWEGFKDKKVRAAFVRKVYSILMLQLLFSLGIIALFVFEPNVKQFAQKHIYVFYIAIVIFLAFMIGIACFEKARRSFPLNIILLIIITMAMSYILGTISSLYDTDVVFMAIGICAAVCLLVSIFSIYTGFDFTSCGGVLCILLLVFIGVGIIAICIPSKVMLIIYSALGAVLFTLYLAFDTQMIMGGKSIEISPEEYVFAAIQLYIDIAYIFVHLLLLIGNVQN